MIRRLMKLQTPSILELHGVSVVVIGWLAFAVNPEELFSALATLRVLATATASRYLVNNEGLNLSFFMIYLVLIYQLSTKLKRLCIC